MTVFRPFVARLLAIMAVATTVLSLPAPSATHATHGPSNPSWVHVKAPFTGQWDKFGSSPPSTHSPGLWGGDWATDYYQVPGTVGAWYASSSSGSAVTASVADSRNSCDRASWTEAGLRYKISVANDSGYLGWFADIHVDPRLPGGATWVLSTGSALSNGSFIGYTYLYSWISNCWEVNTSSGVHWHIVAYNNHNYACYYPRSAGTTLSVGADILGAVGANATAAGQSCY